MDRPSASCLFALLTIAGSVHADEAAESFFETRIRPVLAAECFPCHGGKKTENGLKVDSLASLLRGGDGGPAIVVGDPEKSLLVRAIRYADPELKMPPKRRLPADVAAAFTEWVAQGAVWPTNVVKKQVRDTAKPARHWAFQALKPIAAPPDPTGQATGPIDRFLAAKRATAGLVPVPLADRRTLIRRVTFDLIGLPPTPAEVDEFEHDTSPTAICRVVDRLLASPQYGERAGRQWMDVVRYADTAGDNADYPIPEAARYRDYIIAAFNHDKPFDQFVREQLAGDILSGEGTRDHHAESVIATGFLALSRRYATGPFELWHLTLEDTIETTGRAFMGLTLRCARCHDHKFDPVSQGDYYALYGIFASTTFPYGGSEEFQSKDLPRQNFVPLVEPALAEPKWKAHRDHVERLQNTIREVEAKKDAASARRLKELRAELLRLRRSSLPAGVEGAYAVCEGKPVDAALQRRGEPANPGPVVPRGVPQFAFLEGAPRPASPSHGSGRLELAQWLTEPTNPLTPRVMVNRIWQRHFGRGIVSTPSNFGLRGEPPTHPELINWLASRFLESRWSIKAIDREIVLSRTYQLSSDFDAHNAELDPDDRWLWRFPRQRLDAESLRDAMLAVAGNLDITRPRAHPFPAIENWHWTQHNAFKEIYPSNQRTVYLMTQRLIKHPYLAIFDGPDTNVSTEARPHSTVPLQALYLMNNPFVEDQAAGFARRIIGATTEPAERIDFAYQLAWSRRPTHDESSVASQFIARAKTALAAAGTPAESLEREAWTSLAKVMLTANEFLYTD
jgi:hypothetical protein